MLDPSRLGHQARRLLLALPVERTSARAAAHAAGLPFTESHLMRLVQELVQARYLDAAEWPSVELTLLGLAAQRELTQPEGGPA